MKYSCFRKTITEIFIFQEKLQQNTNAMNKFKISILNAHLKYWENFRTTLFYDKLLEM